MPNEFTQAEWDACFKVLQVLSRDPEQSLDTLTLKGLVTKLYKRAQKDNREQTDQVIQKELVTSSTSSEKLRKFSLQQDWLRQYDIMQLGYLQSLDLTTNLSADLKALLNRNKNIPHILMDGLPNKGEMFIHPDSRAIKSVYR